MRYSVSLIVLFVVSLCLTTIGFLVDTDIQLENTCVTVYEFILMTGIFFVILSALYFSSTFVFGKLKEMLHH